MTMLPPGLRLHSDGVVRCFWATDDVQYRAYHDDEWAVPVHDDTRLFEKLSLEGFQSGLSWLTILRKREGFRRAFAGFDIARIAQWGPSDVQRLVQDEAIVRHRGKIEATLHNAACALRLIETEGSLSRFLWQFVPPAHERPPVIDHAAVRALASTPASVRLSKELKRRHFRFVGPTTAYAFMQAMGLVNDHIHGCPARTRILDEAREAHPR